MAGVAAQLHLAPMEAEERLQSARAKLLAARTRRPTPFVDRTLYTGWNALCISAYLAADRALVLPDALAFALRTLERVLQTAWDPSEGLLHVISYGEAPEVPARIAAVLEDYTFLGNAALDAWESTGERRWFTAAQQLADFLLLHFHDAAGGGFFDTAQRGPGRRTGALAARRKPIQDAPTPAGNASAATLLLRLHALTNHASYRDHAAETLQVFAGVAEHLGLYVASYGQALRRLLSSPVQVCVLGNKDNSERLARAASKAFRLNVAVVRLQEHQLANLPPVLASALPQGLGAGPDGVAVVCREGACMPPVHTPEQLMALLADLR